MKIEVRYSEGLSRNGAGERIEKEWGGVDRDFLKAYGNALL